MNDPQIIERAIQRIAEERIREAEERGFFDNLSGHGKPLPPIPEGPRDAHLAAWMRDWARREGLGEAQREACRLQLSGLGPRRPQR